MKPIREVLQFVAVGIGAVLLLLGIYWMSVHFPRGLDGNALRGLPPPTLVAKAAVLESRYSIAADFIGQKGSPYRLTTVFYLIYDDGSKKEVDVSAFALANVPDKPAPVPQP